LPRSPSVSFACSINTRSPTGIDALDEVLGGLGVGDNVVWQTTNPAGIEPFVEAFLATAHGTTRLIDLSFRLPPARVLDRFALSAPERRRPAY
jgi:hypothetical protein